MLGWDGAPSRLDVSSPAAGAIGGRQSMSRLARWKLVVQTITLILCDWVADPTFMHISFLVTQ